MESANKEDQLYEKHIPTFIPTHYNIFSLKVKTSFAALKVLPV